MNLRVLHTKTQSSTYRQGAHSREEKLEGCSVWGEWGRGGVGGGGGAEELNCWLADFPPMEAQDAFFTCGLPSQADVPAGRIRRTQTPGPPPPPPPPQREPLATCSNNRQANAPVNNCNNALVMNRAHPCGPLETEAAAPPSEENPACLWSLWSLISGPANRK